MEIYLVRLSNNLTELLSTTLYFSFFRFLIILLICVTFLLLIIKVSTPRKTNEPSKPSIPTTPISPIQPSWIIVEISLINHKNSKIFSLATNKIPPKTTLQLNINGTLTTGTVISCQEFTNLSQLPIPVDQLQSIDQIMLTKPSITISGAWPNITMDYPEPSFEEFEEILEMPAERDVDDDSSFEVIHESWDDKDF